MPYVRRFAYPLLLTAVVLGLIAVPGWADLSGQYQSGKQRAKELGSEIAAQSRKIQGYQGTIDNLQARLTAIENALGVQERLLSNVTIELAAARKRLTGLKASEARDQAALAAQLRADYESPPPNIVSVVVDARGFDQLVNGVRNLTAIRKSNVATVQRVVDDRKAVQAQTVALASVQARRRRQADAILGERDDVAQLRLSIVDRQLHAEHIRGATATRLTALRKTLAHEASVLNARAARAAAAAARQAALNGSGGGAAAPPPGGCVNSPFVAHGGEWGFFQSPGTNYSVNEEPVIAARLDTMGKALHLHLIGVSGYRTPQHSVEVGGFADDPHTQGIASDTPGVEGVPEATLEQFCLTRPFPGAREADHIQES
jgi:septal ring factor EnvC (AmiA/AmiB activator)